MKYLLRFITALLVYMVKFYKYAISPYTPNSCRHIPSCSNYTVEALQKHGPVAGTWLGIKRLAKCHPWGTHGFDPVPERLKTNRKS
ncbi:MAG: membrane protein insertion efficiency factor YidD [Bacteroidota bacterium]